MQITVDNVSTLERKLTISIPSEEIESEVSKRLHELAPKVKIDGFRPGKVPFSTVQKRFETSILAEVLNDKINSSYVEATKQENLNPANYPQINPTPYQAGQPFQYEAIIEVFPKITLNDITQIEAEKKIVEITEQDVDEMLEIVRKQFAVWQETQEGALDTDRVVIDYTAAINGETFPEGTAHDQTITLGSAQLYHDFTKNFIGAKTGSELKFKVSYPNDYPQTKFAGQEVEFTAQIKKVMHAELPAIDDQFAVKMGVKEGGVETLRKEIKRNMQREVGIVVQRDFRKAVFDDLVAKNPLDLPKGLVVQEIERLRETEEAQRKQQASYLKINPSQLPLLTDAQLEEKAKYNIALALLVAEVRKSLQIEPNPELVLKKIQEYASTYEKPEEAIAWYQKQPQQLEQIRDLVFEEQLLEALQKQIKITEKPFSYKEILH